MLLQRGMPLPATAAFLQQGPGLVCTLSSVQGHAVATSGAVSRQVSIVTTELCCGGARVGADSACTNDQAAAAVLLQPNK